MLPEEDRAAFTPIEIPRVRRNPWALVKIAAALAVVGGLVGAWVAGYRPTTLLAGTRPSVHLVEIGTGPVDLFVVETGSIESANNTTVRNEVEALMGLVGGSQGATGKAGSSGTTGGSGGSGGQGGASTGGADASSSKSKTAKKSGSSSSASKKSSSGSSGSTSGSSSSSSSGTSKSGSSSSSGGGSSAGGSSGSSSASTATASTGAASKPVLRSFTYMVTPYVPSKSATPKATDASKKAESSAGKGGGGGGGGGRGGGGRGGRGGGGMGEEEKPGSTRIVSILPEGTRVKTGEVVARLDKSAYEDEELSQRIRYLQAESYVLQAQSMLKVAEITLEEYRDGIYPQDLQLIRHYIESCEIEKDRSSRNLKWSREMFAMSFRTKFQVKGDQLVLEQAEIVLKEAQGMYDRLFNFTGPKHIKSLQANVEAIRADLLNQEASFSLEKQRLERLRRNIAHCTVTAPSDGIVVYANQADWRGMASVVIDEGVTLREKQPIFNLPDPQHMRVKAKINESKVALIHTNQPVIVRTDAFPDHPLKGIVAEVTPISIPIRGSDVRIYYANVDITEGFDALRPGLSAEIQIEIERKEGVTRVPVERHPLDRRQTPGRPVRPGPPGRGRGPLALAADRNRPERRHLRRGVGGPQARRSRRGPSGRARRSQEQEGGQLARPRGQPLIGRSPHLIARRRGPGRLPAHAARPWRPCAAP